MTTIEKIKELKELVINANTAIIEGRKIVADSCRELYNLIEEDVYNAGKEWMLKGIYRDLCNGNFSEPYPCECKKTDFQVVEKVYMDNIVPCLN